MAPENSHARPKTPDAELAVLRALCQGTLEASAWQEAVRQLARHRFANWSHQVVFEALRELNAPAPDILREQLPRLVTRRGFPDVDLDVFFQPQDHSPAEVIALVHTLC